MFWLCLRVSRSRYHCAHYSTSRPKPNLGTGHSFLFGIHVTHIPTYTVHRHRLSSLLRKRCSPRNKRTKNWNVFVDLGFRCVGLCNSVDVSTLEFNISRLGNSDSLRVIHSLAVHPCMEASNRTQQKNAFQKVNSMKALLFTNLLYFLSSFLHFVVEVFKPQIPLGH